MPSAISGSTLSPFSPGSNFKVAGRDFWRSYNGSGAANCYAHGELNAIFQGKTNVFIPNSDKQWETDGPIYGLMQGQVLAGDPASTAGSNTGLAPVNMSTIASNIYYCGPMIYLNGPAPALQANTYLQIGGPQNSLGIPYYSFMDSSVTTARFGLRMFGGSQLMAYWGTGAQFSGYANMGMNWSDPTYTVAFSAIPLSAGVPSATATFNAQQFFVVGESWSFLMSDSSHFQMHGVDVNGNNFNMIWPYSATTGLHRFYICIDINKTSFATTISLYLDTGAGPHLVTPTVNQSPAQGTFLGRVKAAPFVLGSTNNCIQSAFTTTNANADFVLSGLHFESGLTYIDGSAFSGGTAGALYRADNHAAWGSTGSSGFNDNYAFYTQRATTGTLARLTDNGTQSAPQEIYCYQGNSGLYNYGMLYNGSVSTTDPSGISLSNLQILSRQWNTGYGGGIPIVGYTGLSITIDRCTLNGGYYGIVISAGANVYVLRIKDTIVSASLIGGAFQNVIGQWNGSAQIVCSNALYGFYCNGCNFAFRDIFFPYCPYGSYFYLDNAPHNNGSGIYIIDNILDDNEGLPLPLDAHIHSESVQSLTVSNSSLTRTATPSALSPNGAAFLSLGSASSSGYLTLDNMHFFVNGSVYSNPTPGYIKVASSAWSGRITNSGFTGNPIFQDSTGGTHGMKAIASDYPFGIPRNGYWSPGQVSECVGGALGTPMQLVCIAPGTYGTTTLPQWQATQTSGATGANNLSAYCMSGFGFTGSASSWGTLSAYALNALAQSYWTGQSYTAPTSFGFALNEHFSNFFGPPPTEVSGNGYTRPALTMGSVSGGSASNSAAIAFPTSTAAWNVNSVGQYPLVNAQPQPIPYWAIYDNASNVLAVGALASPINVTASGQTPTAIAIGAFSVTHAPLNLGGLTTYAANQVLGLLLSSVQPVLPGVKYIGLSSTPISAAGTGATEPAIGTNGYARIAWSPNGLPSGGTIQTGIQNSNIVGIGTHFLTDLHVGQTVWLSGKSQTMVVATITSDTFFTTTTAPAGSTTGSLFNVNTPTYGLTKNLSALTFPTPTGAWSAGAPLGYWFMSDAATGGNILASGQLFTAAVVTSASSPAPSFAPGAFAMLFF